jgi:signal transduction histidine kinase
MKIKNQLYIIFLSLCLFTASVISIVFYYKVKKIVLAQIYDHLESISQTKQIRISFMINKKLEITKIFSSDFDFVSTLNKYIERPSEPTKRIIKNQLLEMEKKSRSLKKLHLLDQNGVVILSTDSTYEGKNYSKTDSYINALNKGQDLGRVFYNDNQELNFYASSQIVYDRKMLGILLIEMDASDLISLTNDYTGLGKTGETIIAKINKDITLLTPVRFDRNAVNKKIAKADNHTMSHLALSNKEGFKTGVVDYRNERVIASTRYFPQTNWSMATKIDENEALLPINQIRNLLLILNFICIIFSFGMAYFLGQYLSKSLEKLTFSINKIEKEPGSGETVVKTKNELGVLINSFNKMVSNLWNNLKELKQSNEDLEKFAYVISHDLRSPISSIMTISDILKNEFQEKLGAEGMRLINMQIDKVNQMNELILGVLESSKKGNKKNLKEEINLNYLIPRVIATIHIPPEIKITVQKNLPIISYYKIPIMQVFQNLIGNAVKFMNKQMGEIKIGCEKENNYYKFSIEDNGPGIKKDDLERIFNMFEYSTTSPGIESSGIGLSIVKKIIEESKGKIWVEPNLKEGCTFFFTLPVEN